MILLLNKLIDWFIAINWSNILTIIMGPIGILIGIFVNEYFKRKSQDSLFSEKIFDKKISIYEKLFDKISEAYESNNKIIENKNLSKEKRLSDWSNIIIPIIEFIDEHKLYISEELAIHCMMTLISGEELGEMGEEEKKQYYKNRNKTIELIKEESGLNRLNKFFGKVNRPKIESDYITYFNNLKKRNKI